MTDDKWWWHPERRADPDAAEALVLIRQNVERLVPVVDSLVVDLDKLQADSRAHAEQLHVLAEMHTDLRTIVETLHWLCTLRKVLVWIAGSVIALAATWAAVEALLRHIYEGGKP